MSILVVILITISAILHTTWNYLTKESVNDTISWTIICLIVSIIASPFIFTYKEILPTLLKFWPFFIVIGFFNALQIWGFLVAYKSGDYTFVYPFKNALPIVLCAIYSVVLGKGGEINLWAYVGFVLIFTGCIILPIKNIKDVSKKNYLNKAFMFTALAALGTSVYSTVDSYVLKNICVLDSSATKIGASLLYVPFLYFSIAVFMILFSFIDKLVFKTDFKKIKFDYKNIFIVAITTSAAYALVLFSYNYASNVSYVVAFRQIGMPISFIVGVTLLKEKIYIGKALGMCVIIAGLVLTAIF